MEGGRGVRVGEEDKERHVNVERGENGEEYWRDRDKYRGVTNKRGGKVKGNDERYGVKRRIERLRQQEERGDKGMDWSVLLCYSAGGRSNCGCVCCFISTLHAQVWQVVCVNACVCVIILLAGGTKPCTPDTATFSRNATSHMPAVASVFWSQTCFCVLINPVSHMHRRCDWETDTSLCQSCVIPQCPPCNTLLSRLMALTAGPYWNSLCVFC